MSEATRYIQATIVITIGTGIGIIMSVFTVVLVNAFLPIANATAVQLIIIGAGVLFIFAVPVIGALLALAAMSGFSLRGNR